MKKIKMCKGFAIILSLMIAFMILPTSVKAASLTVGTGGTYSTLAAALAVAADGDTITLLSDVTESNLYTYNTTGKTVTINGGNHRVTSKDSTTETVYALKVIGSGTLILKDVVFQGGTLNIQTGSTNFGSIGLWTDLSNTGRVLSIGMVSAVGGNIDLSNVAGNEFITIGLYNTGDGVVELTSAMGANVDSTDSGNFTSLKTYGLYNGGSGTININSATGGSLLNEKWFGETVGVLSTSGVVNAMNVTGGSITNGFRPTGTGIHLNYSVLDSTIINATNVSAGNSNWVSFRVFINRGTVNVENIIQTVISGSDFAIYNHNGTVNVGTLPSVPLITGTYNQNATSTLTLNANGGDCVLPSITVAKTGSTNIGALPSVFKNGVEGKWYTDNALTTLFTGNTVTGETTLYAGWPIVVTPITELPIVVTPITELPNSYSMNTGNKVVWEPQPTGGTWEWDHSFFTATFNSPATFTALKAGTSTITYTVGGVSQNITVTVKALAASSEVITSPKTGEEMAWIYASSIFAATSFIGIIYMVRRKVKKHMLNN